MRKAADVKSIDALKRAKAAMVEFREIAGIALAEASSEVQRTMWWVQSDRRTHWAAQVRRRTEKLAEAKSELYRAQLAAMDDRAQCIEQRKLVERAERALAEAQQKVAAVKKWSLVLEREFMLFKGRLQPIARAVEGELPRGEAKLEVMTEKLDKYLRLQAPATSTPTRRSSRREDDTPAASPPTPPTPPTEESS
ncbi:MAG: hypothetical protein GY715_13975 [Planctomycetes bacterium]|nr:hypothetical protein [Planctomycetota bacterium]